LQRKRNRNTTPNPTTAKPKSRGRRQQQAWVLMPCKPRALENFGNFQTHHPQKANLPHERDHKTKFTC